MKLVRLDSNTFRKPDEPRQDLVQEEFGCEVNDEEDLNTLRVKFERFGLGEQKRSDFAVDVTWLDVMAFIREFIKMGEEEALFLDRALKLSDAIEVAGWSPDEPATDTFRRYLMPQSN